MVHSGELMELAITDLEMSEVNAPGCHQVVWGNSEEEVLNKVYRISRPRSIRLLPQ